LERGIGEYFHSLFNDYEEPRKILSRHLG